MSTVFSRDILKTFSNHKRMSIKSLSLNAKKIKKHVTWILLFQHKSTTHFGIAFSMFKKQKHLASGFDCFPASNYMIKVDNTNTRRRCEICSKLYSWSSPKQHHWCHSSVFVTSEQISQLVLVFLLLILSR